MKLKLIFFIQLLFLFAFLRLYSAENCEKQFSQIARVRYQQNLLTLREQKLSSTKKTNLLQDKFGEDWQLFFSTSTKLDLSFTDLDDSELALILKHAPQVNNLILASNPRLTKEGIVHALNNVKPLTGLNLYDTFDTQDTIIDLIIQKHSSLEKLNLDRVSGKELLKLTSLKNLHTLNVTNSLVARTEEMLSSNAPYMTVEDILEFIKNRPSALKKLVLPDFIRLNYHPVLRSADETGLSLYFRPVFHNISFSGDPQDVYDGDTPSISLPWDQVSAFFGGKMKIRIRGIDTPEMKTNDKYEKIGAIAAMHFAYDFLMSAQRIDFNEVDYGKYGGRLLAYVDIIKRSDGKKYSLTQELLAHGFGPDYEGERKLSVDDPDFWKKHYEANKTVIDKWYTITPEITKKKYGQNN